MESAGWPLRVEFNVAEIGWFNVADIGSDYWSQPMIFQRMLRVIISTPQLSASIYTLSPSSYTLSPSNDTLAPSKPFLGNGK